MKGISFSLLLSIVCVVSGKRLFSELTELCSKSDPKFTECMKTSGNKLLPQLVAGIRDFGVPPADPLKIPFVNIDQNIGLKLNITDSTQTGLKDLQIQKFRHRSTAKGDIIEMDATIPKYIIRGTCQTGGRILILPIQGLGPCNLVAVGIDLKLKINTINTEKKGKNYCKLNSLTTSLKFRGGSFELHGLFNGNKELERTMNTFLNENGLEVLNEVKPSLERVWAAIFTGLLGHLFDKVPCDQMVLP